MNMYSTDKWRFVAARTPWESWRPNTRWFCGSLATDVVKQQDTMTRMGQPWSGPVVYSATARAVSPGDKVLCMDAKWLRRTYVPGPPVEGHLYCVREVYVDNGQPGLLLVGIHGPAMSSKLECGFLARRFRWVHD